MNRGYKKNRSASKPNLSFEFAEDKIDIISLLQRKQDNIEESESSSTESMKWVGNEKKNISNPAEQGFVQRNRGVNRCEIVRNTNLGYFNAEVKGREGSESKKGLGVNGSEETVVKNFEKMKKRRINASLGDRSELSKSMLEILRKQDFCESSKETLKLQTRLQVLKAFRQENFGDKGSK